MAELPDSPDLADRAGTWKGAYVHIPFCARVCPYCDFAVVAGKQDWVIRYLDAVHLEIDREPDFPPLDAVFVGGGTPTRVPPEALVGLVDHLRARFGLAEDAEVALEANPEDWTDEMAATLLAGGFTRVSFGAQSMDGDVLGFLGRRHGPDQVASAVRVAREAGFRSVNLDLIFGSPGESLVSWKRTLEEALELRPDHLSTYALTVERGTELGREVAAGAPGPHPDHQADEYEMAREAAGSAGLVHYEVSNFARSGHACRYNLLTWAQGEYLGIGLGAHEHRSGRRSWNLRRLEAYVSRLEAGESPEGGREELDEWSRELERLMLGLRRRAGVVSGRGGERLLDQAPHLQGLVHQERNRLLVTKPLLTDAILREVLALGA